MRDILITVTDAIAPSVCLASASPRRQELLRQIGVEHFVAVADLDESVLPGESPAAYVQRLALAKARAVAARADSRGLPVLGADTAVVVGGVIFGKPADAEDARRMLTSLAGCDHQVLSAVALVAGARENLRLSESRVRFAALRSADIEAYIASGEPFGKAGGYAIQGRAAAFIAHLEGSYSGVMGLPLFETASLLATAGLR
jgi:septum formation protein